MTTQLVNVTLEECVSFLRDMYKCPDCDNQEMAMFKLAADVLEAMCKPLPEQYTQKVAVCVEVLEEDEEWV